MYCCAERGRVDDTIRYKSLFVCILSGSGVALLCLPLFVFLGVVIDLLREEKRKGGRRRGWGMSRMKRNGQLRGRHVSMAAFCRGFAEHASRY